MNSELRELPAVELSTLPLILKVLIGASVLFNYIWFVSDDCYISKTPFPCEECDLCNSFLRAFFFYHIKSLIWYCWRLNCSVMNTLVINEFNYLVLLTFHYYYDWDYSSFMSCLFGNFRTWKSTCIKYPFEMMFLYFNCISLS